MLKKILSVILTLLMILPVSVPFASAQEDDLATVSSADAQEAREYLGTLLDSAVEILTSSEIGTYTPESCEDLEQAINEGYGVYYNPDATAEELSIQADKVKDAINNMKKLAVSEEAAEYLSQTIALAETQVGDESNYTPDSWASYEAVFERALYVQSYGESDEEVYAVANALKDAINALVPVDSGAVAARQYLREVINSAYRVLEGDVRYTADSIDMLESAIKDAESLYQNSSATRQQLYFEADNLMNIINYMEEIVISSEAVACLSDMIAYADAQALKESDYTPDSWAVYISAYFDAVKVLNTGMSDEEYTTAAGNLDNAIKSLVRVDSGVTEARDSLISVINSAYQILNSNEKYTEASTKNLQSAIGSANTVLDDDKSTQQELYAEVSKLENAMESMVKIVISEQAQNSLLQAIAYADDTVGTEYEYTQDSWSTFIEAYEKAVEVLEKGESDEEYSAAANALNDAVSKLVPGNTGRDEALEFLYRTIQSAMDVMDDGQRYTAESYKSLEAAIISASQVYADQNSTEQEIYAEIYNLESAMNSMVKVEISKEASDYLSEAMARAELIVKSDDEYTQDSFSAFDKAYKEAGRVFTKGESDEEYIAAADALNSAIDNLQIVELPTVPANVKSALMKAIISAKTEVDLSLDYTAESLKEFNEAKEYALNVYNNSNSEEEFTQATNRLLAAIDNLQLAYITLILGDTDSDGKVTIKDATLIQKSLAGIVSLEYNSQMVADANCDGAINIKDATEIQKHLASLVSCEEIGKQIQVPAEKTPVEDVPGDEIPDVIIPDEPYSIDYTIAYEFRVGPYEGGWENINLIVRSPQELQDVIDKMDYDYYYRNEDIFPEAYDDAFFEENAVIVSLYLVGGSECSQWIFSATVDGTFLILDRDVFRPDIYPPDMNYQCMYIEVKKADIQHITQVVDYDDLFSDGT